jgi:N-acetylmuramoyl-L-alanine amidase
MIKKIVIIWFLIILCLLGFFKDQTFAEQTISEPKAATIKIGRHQDFIRIVFFTTDDYVQNSSVMLTDKIIKIDFRSPVVFKLIQKEGSVRDAEKSIPKNSAAVEITGGISITAKDSGCVLTIENLDDMKVLRLSKPARLVVDAYIKSTKEFHDKKTLIGEPVDVNSVQFNFFMLDAGHGGHDRGIQGKSFVEKDLTLAFAKEFADILAKKGKKVFLTRKSDQMLSIDERIKSVNQKSPEIFISIHVSSGSEFGIYVSDKVRKQKAKNISESDALKPQVNINIDSITKAIAQNIRTELGISVRHERLQAPIIAHVNTPAFLIELPNPENFTYNKKTKEKMINAILKGFAHSPKGQDSSVNSK